MADGEDLKGPLVYVAGMTNTHVLVREGAAEAKDSAIYGVPKENIDPKKLEWIKGQVAQHNNRREGTYLDRYPASDGRLYPAVRIPMQLRTLLNDKEADLVQGRESNTPQKPQRKEMGI